MKKVVITKQLEVPLSTMIAVADLLIANEITHQIVQTDEENDTIAFEVDTAGMSGTQSMKSKT